jgi:hypothetical protein
VFAKVALRHRDGSVVAVVGDLMAEIVRCLDYRLASILRDDHGLSRP